MKKNFKVMALAGVAAAVAIGGTFAYYTATNTFKNEFNTENFGTSSVEIFNPGDGDNWEPGVKVKKAVYGQNTGDGDVYVRVFFDEEWTRDGEVLTSLSSADSLFETTAFSIQANRENGDIAEGKESVVLKDMQNRTPFAVAADSAENGKWYKGKDGWFYYTAVLKKGDVTNTLLDSVTLASDTDMGKYAYFAKFRKVEGGKGKTDEDLLKENKPSLAFNTAGELYATETDITWYAMKQDEKGYYYIPIADDDQNPLDEEGQKISYDPEKDTFFSYEEKKLDQNHKGYSDADYNLKIKIEYIQADKDHAAVDAQADEKAWEWYPGKETESVAP